MTTPATMQAMRLTQAGQPLELSRVPVPAPRAGQVLIRVQACGVCRTDLHILDGELPAPRVPLILGHEIAGTVTAVGPGVSAYQVGDPVGVPWLGWTCGECRFCLKGQENLCERARFTGFDLDGGYAEYTVADARFCFPLPAGYGFAEAAPLLCAGLIGYRAYRLAGEGVHRLGLYGFGAAAHLLAQIAVHAGQQVYAFTRPGDADGQAFARGLGAAWAGGSEELPPEPLDAAIIFAPVGALVPLALRAVDKGGVVVCGGIHMSDLPGFPYHLLWNERVLRSVANLTRHDGDALLDLVARAPVHTTVETFPLAQANEALDRLRRGQISGAAVLLP
jgi:propanol-preferring alcohol dehydrogenase